MFKTVAFLELKSTIKSHRARAKALANLMKFLGRRFKAFSLAVDWKSCLWKLVIPGKILLESISPALRRFDLMMPSHA